MEWSQEIMKHEYNWRYRMGLRKRLHKILKEKNNML